VVAAPVASAAVASVPTSAGPVAADPVADAAVAVNRENLRQQLMAPWLLLTLRVETKMPFSIFAKFRDILSILTNFPNISVFATITYYNFL
jgi:hypothetical protein